MAAKRVEKWKGPKWIRSKFGGVGGQSYVRRRSFIRKVMKQNFGKTAGVVGEE